MSDAHVPNWSEFEQRPKREPSELSEATKEINRLCARVFTTPDGRDLMEALRKATIDRRTPAYASEAILREIEAQRRLVHELERARDAGLEAMKAKPKPS